MAFVLCGAATIHAQPKLEFALKKPKQFEDRQLGSEKSAEKKFTFIRRFFQNTYTHYNYYYNANNLVNEIISKAASGKKDDYSELLSFYRWSLENTAQSKDIDSILQKCTAGILLHDLRNDWIDNMYLLMGKAYYLRQDFDSAAMSFQFLNYAFAPKDKSGSDKTIGSNADDESNAFSILSKEKKTPILRRPPSRNDGFIWQVRNYTDKGNYLDASSLVSLLRNDPNFPNRLEPGLAEVISYLNYKQKTWDSAAAYLEKSIPEAIDSDDRSRRWFLAGQLYQLANMPNEAAEAYSKCTSMTLDPVMEVYARLNSIRLRKSSSPEIIDQNLKELLQMGKKDKFENFRDIIFYAAALFELERNGYVAAEFFLNKSLLNSTNNSIQKNKSFLLLGDVRYAQKKYGKAGPPYDSLQLEGLKPEEKMLVEARKPGCLEIYDAETIISVQDSLVALADLPEPERIALVKALSRKLKKERGIADEEPSTGNSAGSGFKPNDPVANLFQPVGNTWYFYEPSIRAAGFNNFKERWGPRPNEDNWRRSTALGMMSGKFTNIDDGNPDGGSIATITEVAGEVYDSSDVSFDNLYSRIPISEANRKASNERIINALFRKAESLHNKIEDYPEAIKVYEEILARRDTGSIAEKSLFALIHCYSQIGDEKKAEEMRQKLKSAFGTEALPASKNLTQEQKDILNGTYDNIYGLFIEGRFSEALAARKAADSLLGNSYWSPQLLYIQSVYHIKQEEDSLAIEQLTNIKSKFPDHGLAGKATIMIDVLKRRKEIEAYLTNLEVTRNEDDDLMAKTLPTPIAIPKATPPPSQTPEEKAAAEKLVADRLAAERALAEKEMAEYQARQKVAEEKLEKEIAAKREAQRIADEKALAEKLAQEKAAEEKLEKEIAAKKEAQRIADEKALAEKLAQEKAAEEKALAEKQAAEKLEAEKALAEKLAAEKAEEEKILAEKQAAEKAAAEKAFAEKQAAEKAAMEKDATNKAEASAALAKKQAEEKAAMEEEMAKKQAAEKAAAEKAMAEKQAKEKAAQDKLLVEKLAADKLAADKTAAVKAEQEKAAAEQRQLAQIAADKTAAVKAEQEKVAAEQRRLAQIAADKLATEKVKAKQEAEEKAAIARASMVDNVVISTPGTASPYSISANETQIVAIVLERIDIAYVNEVAYSFGKTDLRNQNGVQVQVNKRKIKDNLWLVTLESGAFINMQQSYNYIKYIKPVAASNILNWLEPSKYYFITISADNLATLEKTGDASLYFKVLKEAVPNKF